MTVKNILDFKSKEADHHHGRAGSTSSFLSFAVGALTGLMVCGVAAICLFIVVAFAYDGLAVAVKEALRLAPYMSLP